MENGKLQMLKFAVCGFPFSIFIFPFNIGFQLSIFHFPFLEVFYFFAVVLLYLSILSLRSGFRFLDYVRQESIKPLTNFAPFATIFAPCRGIDEDLRENLAALFQQNYTKYEIVFAVDDAQDAAVSIIENLREEFADKMSSKLIIAGKAVSSGQKVHNLLSAVEHISPQSEIFAFVDSDARPQEDWLKNLTAPLENPEIGAATGYRWFISKRQNFGSELRSCWNASIASALGANADKNFCWGGSTAIRRETFERIKMPEKWHGALSDDFALMRNLRENNLPIKFVPNCLTVTIEDCTFAECVEFTTRQMKITRVYAPHFWKASLIGSLIFTATFFAGVFLTIYLAISGLFGLSFWLTLAFVVLIFSLGAAKSWVRLEALKLVLPKYKNELARSTLSQTTLWTLAPLLFFYNCLRAAFSRRIKWRGIEYDLKSSTETVIINQLQISSEKQNER